MAFKPTTRIYERIDGAGESPEDYKPGGYHPIHLDDTIAERYQIIRKLGKGTYATVWLAKDLREDRYVALKIAVGDGADVEFEEAVLRHLTSDVHGKALPIMPCPRLYDATSIEGPNGTHRVLVLEVLANTLRDYIEEARRKNRGRKGHSQTSSDFVRTLCRRMIATLADVHAHGIVHRDVQLGNFIFPLPHSIQDISVEALQEGNMAHPIERLDGAIPDKHTPDYIMEPHPFEVRDADLTVKLAESLLLNDFGAAIYVEPEGSNDDDDGDYGYPVDVRAPEVVLGLSTTAASDVWALGCAIFQLVTMITPFWTSTIKGDDFADVNLIHSMIDMLGGPVPARMCAEWSLRDEILDEGGNLLPAIAAVPNSDTLTETMDEFLPACMSAGERGDFNDLIRSTFRYDPAERPSAAELLSHPWLEAKIEGEESGEANGTGEVGPDVAVDGGTGGVSCGPAEGVADGRVKVDIDVGATGEGISEAEGEAGGEKDL